MKINKYKVWDNENKYFLCGNEHFITGYMQFGLDLNGNLNYAQDGFEKSFGRRYIMYQYIGINDINNKEIYEGDIVKIKCYDDWDDDIGYDTIYLVKWSSRHLGYRGFTKCMLDNNYSGVGLPNPIEIIGNVCQNLDLIK